jgi:hypothetical protein
MDEFGEYNVDVRPYPKGSAKGKYDIYVSHDNGDRLMKSSQGYENRAFAVGLALRLFKQPVNVHGMDGSVEVAYPDNWGSPGGEVGESGGESDGVASPE